MGIDFTEDLYIIAHKPHNTLIPTLQMRDPRLQAEFPKLAVAEVTLQAARFPANTLSSATRLGSHPDHSLTHSFLTQNLTVLSPKLEQVLTVGVMLTVPPP